MWLWFTQEQWKSIVPPYAKTGMSFPLSEAVADRIVRLTLLNTIY